MKKIALILILLVMCTGCWNYKELSELGIVSAMAISKKDGKYVVDLQMINILEGGDKGVSESPITVVSGSGNTIADAVRSINMKSSKVFFSSNLEYVFIDPSIFKEDVTREVLDFLARDTKLSLNFLIITSTLNSSREILSSLSQFNMNAASNLSEVIKLSEQRYGPSYSLNIKEFLAKFLDKGVTPVYPNVYLYSDSEKLEEAEEKENENSESLELNGEQSEGKENGSSETLEKSDSEEFVAVYNLVTFDKNGEVINLGFEESFGYNFLNNHITNATVSSKCDDNYFTIETLKSGITFEDKLKEDKLVVKGEVEAEVFFYGCDYDLNDSKTLDKLSKKASKEIENYIKKTITLSQNSKTDFAGIGNWIYKNNKSYFNKHKKNWEEDWFPKLEFDYDINVTLFKQGNLKGDI